MGGLYSIVESIRRCCFTFSRKGEGGSDSHSKNPLKAISLLPAQTDHLSAAVRAADETTLSLSNRKLFRKVFWIRRKKKSKKPKWNLILPEQKIANNSSSGKHKMTVGEEKISNQDQLNIKKSTALTGSIGRSSQMISLSRSSQIACSKVVPLKPHQRSLSGSSCKSPNAHTNARQFSFIDPQKGSSESQSRRNSGAISVSRIQDMISKSSFLQAFSGWGAEASGSSTAPSRPANGSRGPNNESQHHSMSGSRAASMTNLSKGDRFKVQSKKELTDVYLMFAGVGVPQRVIARPIELILRDNNNNTNKGSSRPDSAGGTRAGAGTGAESGTRSGSASPRLLRKQSNTSNNANTNNDSNGTLRSKSVDMSTVVHLQQSIATIERLSSLLQDRGLSILDDVEVPRPGIEMADVTMDKIDRAKCVCVFVTEEYALQVNGSDLANPCRYELSYACHHIRPLVFAVLDRSMLNTANWTGLLATALAVSSSQGGSVLDLTGLSLNATALVVDEGMLMRGDAPVPDGSDDAKGDDDDEGVAEIGSGEWMICAFAADSSEKIKGRSRDHDIENANDDIDGDGNDDGDNDNDNGEEVREVTEAAVSSKKLMSKPSRRNCSRTIGDALLDAHCDILYNEILRAIGTTRKTDQESLVGRFLHHRRSEPRVMAAGGGSNHGSNHGESYSNPHNGSSNSLGKSNKSAKKDTKRNKSNSNNIYNRARSECMDHRGSSSPSSAVINRDRKRVVSTN